MVYVILPCTVYVILPCMVYVILQCMVYTILPCMVYIILHLHNDGMLRIKMVLTHDPAKHNHLANWARVYKVGQTIRGESQIKGDKGRSSQAMYGSRGNKGTVR
jgi:hypothetical protein